jgi:triacylglycerol esterase/lipase EstA (alpha/beta hydrolase family)
MLSLLSSTTTSKTDFSAESKFISLADNRSLITYSMSICFSIYKECISRLQRANNPLKATAKNLFPILQKDRSYSDVLQPWVNGEDSSQLIVLIHGLNSSPLCWSKYIQKLSECKKSTSYFAPYVYKKGYCKLKKASQPIFEVIQKYAHQHPHNPIILVGHSNGARIAQYIERNLDAKNITLVSIAGPHLGSKLVNWTTFLSLNSSLGISDSMANELMYNSEWAKRKLIKWQKNSVEHVDKVGKRIFIASADDLRIFPNSTSFPNLPNSTYLLISGESHVTIVDAVCEKVLNEVL